MPERQLPARGTVIGFDFGLARIGVAVGELEIGNANALATLHESTNDGRFTAIEKLFEEWRPVALVVGVPFHLDGQAHEMTARCQRFANQLRGRFQLPVFEYDERLTSANADQVLREAGETRWTVRKASLDAVAAQLILQDFLDGFTHAIA